MSMHMMHDTMKNIIIKYISYLNCTEKALCIVNILMVIFQVYLIVMLLISGWYIYFCGTIILFIIEIIYVKADYSMYEKFEVDEFITFLISIVTMLVFGMACIKGLLFL